MSKDVVNVDGEPTVVREDTAKAYRGVNWMVASLLAFIVIAGIVAAVFLLRASKDGEIKTPSQITNANAANAAP